MTVFPVKRYKTIKDENGNKIQVPKSKEEWNKETKNGTATWYFVNRYKINGTTKQYKSALFTLKRDAEEQNALFKVNPIEYIKTHSKRAKNSINEIYNDSITNKNLNIFFENFIDWEIKHNKETTAYAHKNIWDNQFKDEIGALKPEDITLALTQRIHNDIDKKINTRSKRLYSTPTKNTFHSVLSVFFDYLKRLGIIEINYATIVGSFKNPNENKNIKKKIRFQDLKKYELFMGVVDDDFWYAFFNFLFWHGPRKGEQRALKIKNIESDFNVIHFSETFTRNKKGGETLGPIKNGKERYITIAEQSKPYLIKLINFYKQMDGYSDEWFLFGGPINTNKNRIERALKYYYNRLKEKYPNEQVNELTHHEFGRHSHASLLLNTGLQKGISLEELYSIIATRLGDTVEVVKNTYAHPNEIANNDKAKEILKL